MQVESLKQLRLLGGLAGKLNRLNDIAQIGETIVADLEAMVDYHNARVYVLDDDGATLEPVAFRGTIDEYAGRDARGSPRRGRRGHHRCRPPRAERR